MRVRSIRWVAGMVATAMLGACATLPEQPPSVEFPQDISDQRARFTDIFCNVLQQRGATLPDYRDCKEAISPLAPATGDWARFIDLPESHHGLIAALVPGIGYSCFSRWLHPDHIARENLRRQGFDLINIEVDALSGTARNAERIRGALLAMQEHAGQPRIVLIGYSKGTPDILEAVSRFPELHSRIAAVVSIAGAVGGSPIADDYSESLVDLLAKFPGAKCDIGDSEAVSSLRPDVRRAWLATHTLPAGLRYYSVITLPERDRISRMLVSSYKRLAKIDPLNDSQVIYKDQFIPGSVLLGFVNADHWSVVLPIHRAHAVVGKLFVSENDYPREALLEAIMRFVDEDLANQPGSVPPPAEQSVADCTAPSYASDFLVCSTPGLLELDRQLQTTLAAADMTRLAPDSVLFEAQDTWFKRRSRCSFSMRHADCLRSAYMERIAILSVLGTDPDRLASAPAPASCSGFTPGTVQVRVITRDHDLAIILDQENRILSIAVGDDAHDDWSPYLHFSIDGNLLRLVSPSRDPMDCRLAGPVRPASKGAGKALRETYG